MASIDRTEALGYHIGGKLSTKITKPCANLYDLSLAYSPGVAIPCLEIDKDEELAYKYTGKGNLVAVVSNSTAVLGLGTLNTLGGKPVMEGKCVLFKRFADVDGYDIMIDEKDPQKIVEVCRAISKTFGGINLEDIKAPECFYIERELQKCVDIPIMHDDQHGTAMITTAGLINALEISGKDISKIKIAVSGAGASGIACAKMYKDLGAKHIVMCDSKGVIHTKREDFDKLNPEKKEFAIDTDDRTLADAMKGADMFLGLSKAGVVSKEMVASMNADPIIFACANPDPEIFPEDAKAARTDKVMVGTGRSDYPNQVNNVLGFPYIFRGAMDVRATKITEGMKMAAAKALAELARTQPVLDEIRQLVGNPNLEYGPDYIIPNPLDPRVLTWVAPAVAEAAVKEGVARVKDFDKAKYIDALLAKRFRG